MKLVQIEEATHIGQKQWYLLDDGGDEYRDLVGPFRNQKEAHDFMRKMIDTYAHTKDNNVPVTFNLDYLPVTSPRQYEQNVIDHHEWLNNEN